MLSFRSPLRWPDSIVVTPFAKQSNDSGFSPNMSLTDAINFLKEEIEALNIGQATLYTDFEQPHVERLRKKVGGRTGACLYIGYRDHNYVITCDKWQRLEHNIYAMHLVLRQWSNMPRWGIGNLSTLMAGFEVEYIRDSNDTFSSEDIVECLKTFGLGSSATIEDATAIYHRRAKSLAHDNDGLVQLNIQMDEIRSYFASKETE